LQALYANGRWVKGIFAAEKQLNTLRLRFCAAAFCFLGQELFALQETAADHPPMCCAEK